VLFFVISNLQKLGIACCPHHPFVTAPTNNSQFWYEMEPRKAALL